MLANRINRIRIKNYRSLADIDMTFEDLTVLVGPNGSGKSNIVDALRFVRDALTLGLENAVNVNYRDGIDNLLPFTRDNSVYSFQMEFELTIDHEPATYNFTASLNPKLTRRILYVTQEACSTSHNFFSRIDGTITSVSKDWQFQSQTDSKLIAPVNELGLGYLSSKIDTPDFSAVWHLLSKSNFYAITPNIFRPPQAKSKPYPLDEHGANLVSTLHDFITSSNQWLPDLNESLALVVPELSSENTISTQDIGGYLIVQLHHKDGSQFVLAHESEGTLRVLGILTALYQNPPLPLTAIEEPELGIHPHAIGVLADVLYEASHRTQLLLTTHSPDLISRLAPESLRLVERDPKDGTTKIGKITPENLASVEEKLFSSGDLLRIGALRRDH